MLGGLAIVFAVINRHEVRVNWLLGTWETPLIVVIAVAFLAGFRGRCVRLPSPLPRREEVLVWLSSTGWRKNDRGWSVSRRT